MPSIEFKSLDRLKTEDVLFNDAGNLLKAGKEISERIIREFANHKVLSTPTISPSYEEREQDAIYETTAGEQTVVQRTIQDHENTRFKELRRRVKEKVISFYVPFVESESIFATRGKKKQISKDMLLEKDPGPLYRDDINAGSRAILKPSDMSFINEILKQIYSQIDHRSYLSPETRKGKDVIQRVHLSSIRLHSLYDHARLRVVGDATTWQAVDTALLFLFTMTNLNKKRAEKGCPLAEARFDPDQPVGLDMEVRYAPGRILDATVGIFLGNLGYSHKSIHPLIPITTLLDKNDPRDKKRIRVLQRSGYVSSHLLGRMDISSVSRMMCLMRRRYPDGTGFPPLNENRFLHEFVRLYQIIDFYDEMTRPVLFTAPFSRMEVIDYMLQHSGEYRYSLGRFSPQPRFDAKLLSEFLQILKPFEVNEKVYLYPKGLRNEYLFVGRVFSYADSFIPLISILKDEKRNKNYRFGDLVIYIPNSIALFRKNGKLEKTQRYNWIGELEVIDRSINSGHISEYDDVLYGQTRILSKRQRLLAEN